MNPTELLDISDKEDLSLIGEKNLIKSEKLNEKWKEYKELPCNYRLSYEDLDIQEKATTYFQFEPKVSE